MTGELWTKHDVAAFLGIAVTSVLKTLQRWGVEIAERRIEGGRVTNYYRADDVRSKAASAPGKGNRTPRG